MQCAGLIVNHSPHYLDHLAPLCSLLNWPLIVCDPSIAEQCRQFYPQVELIFVDFLNLTLPPCVVSCDTRPMLSFLLGPLKPWRGRLIWLPHGLSDKGWKGPFFEALGSEDLLLVYGQRMRDILLEKKIELPQVSVGNFRLQFYQKHRSFYETLLEEKLGSRRFILYAPTWEDSEDNGTFWEAFFQFLKMHFFEHELLIKLHPNTEKRFGPKLERCRKLAESHGKISFIDSFPPIHALLSRADAYIGDMSSIGYDFLSFEKPLFFLCKQKLEPSQYQNAFLMQTGKQILLDDVPNLLLKSLPTQSNGRAFLQHCFDSQDWQQTAQSIRSLIPFIKTKRYF